MKIFVTGSSGRVGRAVVRELAARGHEVTGYDLLPPKEEVPGFRHNSGSLDDAGALEAAFASAGGSVDSVLHIGALMSWNDADIPRMYASNVDGTFRLLECVAKRRIKRFVFISSGETYPEGRPAYLPVDERHPQKPLSFYGETKLLGERLTEFYGAKYGFSWTILRISHTQDAAELLDPQSFFSGPRFFLKAKIERDRLLGKAAELAVLERLDDGKERLVLSRGEDGTPYMMHITETRDTAAGIVLAMESDKAAGEAFNIGYDEPVAFEEAIPLMSKLTGLPFVEARLPGQAVHYRTSNLKARHHLGYRPEWSLERMLREAQEAREARASKGVTGAKR
jgi:UDP-glucose 4-epimerase